MPEEAKEIPDIYVDQMRVTTGVYSVNITFGLGEPHPTQGGIARSVDEKVRLRMSLQHAKIMTMILRRQIKQYERESGTEIQIPANVYTGLGVAQEDW
jgi:hypothetical protein